MAWLVMKLPDADMLRNFPPALNTDSTLWSYSRPSSTMLSPFFYEVNPFVFSYRIQNTYLQASRSLKSSKLISRNFRIKCSQVWGQSSWDIIQSSSWKTLSIWLTQWRPSTFREPDIWGPGCNTLTTWTTVCIPNFAPNIHRTIVYQGLYSWNS